MTAGGAPRPRYERPWLYALEARMGEGCCAGEAGENAAYLAAAADLARRAEREACATLAEQSWCPCGAVPVLAAAIRARGAAGGPQVLAGAHPADSTCPGCRG